MTGRETLVHGGIVADGSGGEPVAADVLIRSGRIAAVEPPGVIPARDLPVLDAAGLVVAPGFIDVHSHADNAPLLAEHDTSKILQGVTTEVVGNCGASIAPTPASFSGRLMRNFPGLAVSNWSTWTEYTAQIDALGSVTNYAPLVGHCTLREAVLGMADAAPDADELAAMGRELDLALEGGAFGLSSGLIYAPGVFSETEELVALARHLGSDGLYATHMRGEGASLLSAIAEAVRIGVEGGTRVHISHLKSFGRPY
jgi:N-acyl-D-amino-acid deacylase